MPIDVNYIEEGDILLFNEKFSFKRVSPLAKVNWNKNYFFTTKKDTIGIVIENNFGSTHEQRYISLLYENRIIYASLSSKHYGFFKISNNTFTKVN